MRTLKNFILYNNTIPLVLGVLFLGSTLTFAANEEARDAVLSSEAAVTAVDNSYIRNVNLDVFDVEISVDRIEEDMEYYYVYYLISTISLVDGVWQPVTQERTLQVLKNELGDEDLGLYVTKQLSDLYNYEKRLLADTQEAENSIGPTNKTITTEYSGLLGRMLDPENEVFPGYDPVVTPPPAIPGPTPRVFEERLDSGDNVVIENIGGGGASQQPEPSVELEEAASSTPSATSTSQTEPDTAASSTIPVEQEPTPDPLASSSPSTEPEPVSEPESIAETEEESQPDPPVVDDSQASST